MGLTYRAGRALQLFAQMNQMVSVPDDNRDLLEPMMTTRLSFGAGLVDVVEAERSPLGRRLTGVEPWPELATEAPRPQLDSVTPPAK